jgi:hypothetical protein
MDTIAAVLLVTWIMPGGDQPNVMNSYQSTFASMVACEAARDGIFQDAQRINIDSRTKWEPIIGVLASTHDVQVSAVCAEANLRTNTDETTRTIPRPGWEIFKVPSKMTDIEIDQAVRDVGRRAEYKWARAAAEFGVAEA